MKEDHKSKQQYDDIMNLPRHVSNYRRQMSALDRAAQFSPFAALTGYDSAIKETARLTDQKIELEESVQAVLDEKLKIMKEQLIGREEVEVVYFQADERKGGGAYLSKTGMVKKIIESERIIMMQDATRIPIADIIEITGEGFLEL